MQFIVKRTSDWEQNNPPCRGAVETLVQVWDFRTFKTPQEHDAKLCQGHRPSQQWLEKGTEHGTYEGGIKRRLDDKKGWVIEINSLEELIEFSKEYGELVVSNFTSTNYEVPTIEIYDDYRE